jgi:hypothetical protein
LVCIISVVWFEFHSFLIFKSSHADTCIRTQISWIQVIPSKFAFVKIKLIEIFREFLRFSPQGLNSFKNHRRFKFESVPKIIT